MDTINISRLSLNTRAVHFISYNYSGLFFKRELLSAYDILFIMPVGLAG